jgi:hypothetical protein
LSPLSDEFLNVSKQRFTGTTSLFDAALTPLLVGGRNHWPPPRESSRRSFPQRNLGPQKLGLICFSPRTHTICIRIPRSLSS